MILFGRNQPRVKAFYVCLICEPLRWLAETAPFSFLPHIKPVFALKTHILGCSPGLFFFFTFYGIFFLDLQFEERIIYGITFHRLQKH
jgi:hypothetical protein